MKKEFDGETLALAKVTLRTAAILSGIFFGVLAVLLTANALQLAINPPLENPALLELTERLYANPSDETLREEIRALNLLSRRAYFTRRRQMETGLYMLIGGFSLFLLFLKGWSSVEGKPFLLFRRNRGKYAAAPDRSGTDPPEKKTRPLLPLLIGGSALFAAALVSAGVSASMVRFDKPADSSITEETATEAAAASEIAASGTGAGTNAAGGAAGIAALTEKDALLEKQWPSFRGPWGLGKSTAEKVPTAWDISSGEGLLWQSAVPKPGFSSPILWENMIFLTGGDAEGFEVYRFDLTTGELVWSRNLEDIIGTAVETPKVTDDTGYAAATMTVYDDAVFAVFASGDLVALDFDGRLLWHVSLGVPDNLYGHSSSLIALGGLLFVQYDHNREAALYALDTSTGEQAWKAARDVVTSWASPVIIQRESGAQIILNADPYVIAYNPFTGEELWRADIMGGEVAVSIAYDGERVYAANQYAVAAAINPHNGGVLWEDFIDLPEVSSPLAEEGLLIMATSYGIVTCREGETGTLLWEKEFDQGFYASPVSAEGVVYLADRLGTVHLFKVSGEYEPLGAFPLGEPVDATPALAEGTIIFRGLKSLFRIGETP